MEFVGGTNLIISLGPNRNMKKLKKLKKLKN